MMYMHPHPDMAGHPPPEMPVDAHYRGPMMPMPYGVPYPHMPQPLMHPQMPMNPNVPQFIPASQQPKRESGPSFNNQGGSGPSLQPQRTMTTSSDVSVSDKPRGSGAPNSTAQNTETSAPAVSKPVSRRLPIIDPVTGEEISIKPVTSTAVPAAPASALVNADVAFGTVSGTPTPKIVSRTTSDVTGSQAVPEPIPDTAVAAGDSETTSANGKPKPLNE